MIKRGNRNDDYNKAKTAKVPKKRTTPRAKALYQKFMNQSVIVHLISGLKVKGKLTDFDQYTIAVSVKGEEVMLFKHAVGLIRPYKQEDEDK